MKKVEIGIYKNHKEYFALGISGYNFRKIKDEDKHCLALKIKNELNRKKINSCFIRPLILSYNQFLNIRNEDLEAIARTMSFGVSNEKLEVKINNKIYIKNE